MARVVNLVLILVVANTSAFTCSPFVKPSFRPQPAETFRRRVASEDAAVILALREERDKALKHLKDIQGELEHRTSERKALAAALEDATVSLQEYRRIVDEFHLPVSKATGGRLRRTKDELASDVIRALRSSPNHIPLKEFEREVEKLGLGSDSTFKKVHADVKRSMLMNRARLSEWVGDKKAHAMLKEILRQERKVGQ